MKTDELTQILDTSKGERELCRFIKENPFVLIESLNYFGQPVWVISEFPLGNDHYADFVVLAPYSGAFEIKLIEIEPPSSPIFNKNGTLAKKTNKALEQVNSWKTYIAKNRPQFLRDIEKYGTEKDLIRKHDKPITCTAGWRIHHPKMGIHTSFDIIIGRRRALNEKDMERKAAFQNNNGISLVTCDRLLTGTAKIDASPEIYL
jgi:hypothetical protein